MIKMYDTVREENTKDFSRVAYKYDIILSIWYYSFVKARYNKREKIHNFHLFEDLICLINK